MSLQPELALLVLLAALLHASWNALVKKSGERLAVFAISRAVEVMVGGTALLLLPPMASAAWPYVLASAAIHLGYYYFLLGAYGNGDLGQVYPIARGSGPLLVAGLTAATAIEVPTWGGVAGILVLSCGIIGLAFAGGQRPGSGRGIAMAFATALTIAAYTVTDGLGVRASAAPLTYAAWLFVLSGGPLAAVTALARRRTLRTDLRSAWLPGTTAGVFTLAAYGIVLYAMSQGTIAYVAALRETSVLFAALIATLALREPFGRRRIIAAGVIAAGLAVLQIAG